MISGVEALTSLDEALQQVRRQMQELDQQIQASGQSLSRLGEQEVDAYRRLAAIRLDLLTRGSVLSRLDETDRHVSELLSLRVKQLEAICAQLLECHQKQSELEAQRLLRRQDAAQIADQLDKAEAATQERLREDPGHQKLLEKAQTADSIAIQAEKKTEHAQNDLTEKGVPYESDTIFMYLWRRGFGTSAYSAGPLTRFLDGWVARLCRYHDARANYSMLLEIPTRLREHAKWVRAAANQEFTSLKSLEESFAKADGIPKIHESLAESEKHVAAIDAEITKQEVRYRDLSQQQAAFGAGEDELYRQCFNLLLEALRRDGIAELRQMATDTPSAEDNVIVQRLEECTRSRESLQETLRGYQQLHERHLARLQELEKVRHNFKNEQFDRPNSTFSDGSTITAVLREFLRGMATSPELWETIQRQQRPRWTQSDPGFGSGGFPGTRGGAWHTPIPGPTRMPTGGGGRARSGGGGGFSTGGGF